MSPPLPPTQTAVKQTSPVDGSSELPLTIVDSAPIPELPSKHHVLVRVLAVALNPNDHKMVTHFNLPGGGVGCDFCGIIEGENGASRFLRGTRVCGALFPYNPKSPGNGSFAQFCSADERLLVPVPEDWSDLQAASLGVGWSTLCLALSDANALGLEGLPTKPIHTGNEPVLVYGGGTACGTMACQLLRLMGYRPIAVASSESASLAMQNGAVGTASYTSKDCINEVKKLAKQPIRLALDCITDMESTALCFSAMARTGGKYACLEECPEAYRTRRIVKVSEVMGFQVLGVELDLGDSTYTRKGDEKLLEIGMLWSGVMQKLMESGELKPHPLNELEGGFQSILDGLKMLRRGEVRRQKLVVRIP